MPSNNREEKSFARGEKGDEGKIKVSLEGKRKKKKKRKKRKKKREKSLTKSPHPPLRGPT